MKSFFFFSFLIAYDLPLTLENILLLLLLLLLLFSFPRFQFTIFLRSFEETFSIILRWGSYKIKSQEVFSHPTILSFSVLYLSEHFPISCLPLFTLRRVVLHSFDSKQLCVYAFIGILLQRWCFFLCICSHTAFLTYQANRLLK